MNPAPSLGAPLLVLLAALAACALSSTFAAGETLNPDGVAYALIAEHAAEGRFGLAVNGYWGPLLPWTAAPLVAFGAEPLLAVRIVVALSAVVFAAGAASWCAATGLSAATTLLGAMLAALAGFAWSSWSVTPDLLLAGITAFAAAAALRAFESPTRGRLIGAGALFGFAYLAKGVGLPAGILTIATIAHMESWTGRTPRRDAIRRAATIAAGMLLVALPWIAVISLHYGRFTFSTTGAYAHAAVGPGDVDRYWPTFRTFHVPEAGRVTSWEDPTALPAAAWSPFESLGTFRHQMRVVLANLSSLLGFLRGFDVLGIGLAAAALASVASGERHGAERWRWSGAIVVAQCAIYLLVFADSERYFWVAAPFLASAALGLGGRIATDAVAVRWIARAVYAVAVLVAFLPSRIPGHLLDGAAGPGLVAAVDPPRDARSDAARAVADAIRTEGLGGPICGDTREAMLAAFLLRRPCHGEMLRPTPADLLASGAEVFVLRDGGPAHLAVRVDPAFRPVPLARPGRVVVYAARVGVKIR